jgi:hypothetical protein
MRRGLSRSGPVGQGEFNGPGKALPTNSPSDIGTATFKHEREDQEGGGKDARYRSRGLGLHRRGVFTRNTTSVPCSKTPRSNALAQGELIRVTLEHQMNENDRTLIAAMLESFRAQAQLEQIAILDRNGAPSG